MTAPDLCNFCRELVFWKVDIENPRWSREHYRPVRDIQNSVACPFCNTFKASIAAEHPTAKGDAECEFRLCNYHDGFIELTVTICDPTQAGQDLDLTATTWNRNAEGSVPTKQLHWMIAYAEGRSYFLFLWLHELHGQNYGSTGHALKHCSLRCEQCWR